MPGTVESRAPTTPAGFWQRYAAWTLDGALLAIPAGWLSHRTVAAAAPAWTQAVEALSSALRSSLRLAADGEPPLRAATALLDDRALSTAAAAIEHALAQTLAAPLAWFALLAFAWHVGFEQSSWRGSPGKRLLGLQVTDHAGGKPASRRSAGRFVAGTASWATLNLGHLMAAVPPRRLALHDRLSGTRVVAQARVLPGWARAWLWLQLLALLAANAWLLHALGAAMQAALEQLLAIQTSS